MTFESEPLYARQLSNEPLLPVKPRRWTPAFRFLFILVALIGLAATIFGISGTPLGTIRFPSSQASEAHILAIEQAAFFLNSVFFVICVAGLWFTKDVLLRVGLVLRVIALLGAILLELPTEIILFFGFQSWIISLYSSPIFLSLLLMPLFEVALGILGFLSQLCFSYGLARWQISDRGYLWFQIVVTLGLGSIIYATSSFPSGNSWAFALWEVSGSYLSVAALVWFLLRPACWKASPLIVLCLTAGLVISLVFSEVIERFLYSPGSTIEVFQISYAISLVGSTVFILGVLLLIQRLRGQKNVDAPNLAGDDAQMTQPEQDAPGPAATWGKVSTGETGTPNPSAGG